MSVDEGGVVCVARAPFTRLYSCTGGQKGLALTWADSVATPHLYRACLYHHHHLMYIRTKRWVCQPTQVANYLAVPSVQKGGIVLLWAPVYEHACAL